MRGSSPERGERCFSSVQFGLQALGPATVQKKSAIGSALERDGCWVMGLGRGQLGDASLGLDLDTLDRVELTHMAWPEGKEPPQ